MTQRLLLNSVRIEDLKAVRRSGPNRVTLLTTLIGVIWSGKAR